MTSSRPSSPPAGSDALPSPAGGGGDGGEGGFADAPLAGIGILVTRPREQATGLMHSLEQLGARPILFPALAILPPHDPNALGDTLNRLDQFQLAIFISPTAVQRGLAAVSAVGDWPAHLPVAAVGKGTAGALHAQGVRAVLAPDSGSDSEHLLALPQMQDMAGRRVIIFRGEGGRERLAEGLRQRGAQVTYAECYRRGLPEQPEPAAVLDMFAAGKIQAVTAYSTETLDNLFRLLPTAGQEHLMRTPLFVPHPRIAAHARALGVATVVASEGGEAQLIGSLVEYFAHD